MWWDEPQVLEARRELADQIEGFREGDSYNLFHRDAVEVEDAHGNTLKALVYHQDAPDDIETQCEVVPIGDWLQRRTK